MLGCLQPSARISPVKGDPVVPAGTFIDPRLHAISMREPRFLWRSPLIVGTKTIALFGPE
jgi:hypothetical protein